MHIITANPRQFTSYHPMLLHKRGPPGLPHQNECKQETQKQAFGIQYSGWNFEQAGHYLV